MVDFGWTILLRWQWMVQPQARQTAKQEVHLRLEKKAKISQAPTIKKKVLMKPTSSRQMDILSTSLTATD